MFSALRMELFADDLVFSVTSGGSSQREGQDECGNGRVVSHLLCDMFKEKYDRLTTCIKEMLTFFQKTGHFLKTLALAKKIC